MGDVTPAQTSFNGGELTPRLTDRVDQAIRQIGLREMLGFLPLLQGPAEAAPGMIFTSFTKGPCRVIPFQFSVTQSYIIELGDYYMRFYTNDAQIMSGGVPYEIATPYSYAQISGVWQEQNYDALYLFHASVPPQRLIRTSADTFQIQEFVLRNGPLDERNSDEGWTVAASGTTGDIVITANRATFANGDTGGYMEIEGGDFSSVPSWEPGITTSFGALRQWNGRVYQAAGSGRTGTVAPIHIEGTEWDGMGAGTDINGKGPYGIQWTYLYDRFGLIKFTGYTSPTTMTATVIRRLPTTAPSWRWRFGAFSARRGFPSRGVLWQDRLVMSKNLNVYASVSESIDDHAYRNELGDISRDMAFVRRLPTANPISWLVAATPLIVGTTGEVHLIGAGSAGQGAGPGNLNTDTPDDEGAAQMRSLKINGRVLYVETGRRKVVQLVYDTERMVRQESKDLCRYADHIGNPRFRSLAWQKKPEKLIWAVLDDGTMAVAAYNPDELLLGWARRNLADGLSARSMTSISDPTGTYQQIWLAVEGDERFGNRWMIMRMAAIRRAGDNARNHVMLDAAIQYQGPATVAVSAPHLAGQTVQIVADGKIHRDMTLDDAGATVLDYAASDIIVGLPYPAQMTTLPLEGGSESGTAQGKKRRVYRVDVGVILSDGVEVTAGGVTELAELTHTDSATDSALPLFTGYVKVENIGSHETGPTVTVRRYLPMPCTIGSIVPYVTVSNS